MSSSVLLPELIGGAGTAAVSVLAVGVFGMGIVDSIQNITDEGGEPIESETSTEEPSDGLDDDSGQAMGDGGDLDALANDESALDMDDADGDGDMGELAGMGSDGSSAELENRVDTVEGELERLSSTMSTVRSENEEISDAVDEVQENVRQLLEIYEMVTRGVNPFVDEAPDGAFAGDAASGSIGVFDDGEDEEDTGPEDDLDEEVVDADAEAFFDDGLDDGEPPEENDTPEEESTTDTPKEESTTDTPEEESTTDTPEDSTSDDDSKSFEELKDEYDSDDSDLTEGVSDSSGEAPKEPGADTPDTGPEEAAADAPAVGDNAVATSSKSAAHSTDSDDGGPYLETMPTGYAGDLVVMEWLTDLVSEAGPQETRQAISYYAEVGWISEAAEGQLRTVVDGIADTEAARREGEGTIGVEHHRRSIATIDRLAGPSNRHEHGD